ncbi:MAG TPA: hypothetical protein DER56_05480 [Thermosipho africanus]|nr:hypothetical protein [Thermosipho africanus]
MPNFNTHVNFGIYFYPFVLLIYKIASQFLNFSMPEDKIIAIGFLIFVLSSDMPDIDHNHSLLHRFVKLLTISAAIYFEFTGEIIISYFNLNVEDVFLRFLFSFLFGILIGILYELIIPRHRGTLHTVWASLIYGGIIGYGTFYITSNLNNALFLGIISVSGYVLHLILDRYFVEKDGKLGIR